MGFSRVRMRKPVMPPKIAQLPRKVRMRIKLRHRRRRNVDLRSATMYK